MKEFGMIFLLLVLGTGMAFFVKGLWEVSTQGDDFRFVHFVEENRDRIYLMIFGLIILGPFIFFDPVGLNQIFEQLPYGLQIASPSVLGFAVAGIAFILPRNSKSETPEGGAKL